MRFLGLSVISIFPISEGSVDTFKSSRTLTSEKNGTTDNSRRYCRFLEIRVYWLTVKKCYHFIYQYQNSFKIFNPGKLSKNKKRFKINFFNFMKMLTLKCNYSKELSF